MRENSTHLKDQPFSSDADYLDAEFSWLRCLVEVHEVGRDLDDLIKTGNAPHPVCIGRTEQVQVKNARRRLLESKREETEFRSMLNSRLDAHRQKGDFKLGLDIICKDNRLEENERLILLILLLPAISINLAQDVLNSMHMFGNSIPIHEIIGFLGAEGCEDWLKYRKYFYVDSPLLRNKFITIRFPSKTYSPADLLSAEVDLSINAMSIITGFPELLFEGETSED